MRHCFEKSMNFYGSCEFFHAVAVSQYLKSEVWLIVLNNLLLHILIFSILVLMVLAGDCPHLPHQDYHRATHLTDFALLSHFIMSFTYLKRMMLDVINCFKSALLHDLSF